MKSGKELVLSALRFEETERTPWCLLPEFR